MAKAQAYARAQYKVPFYNALMFAEQIKYLACSALTSSRIIILLSSLMEQCLLCLANLKIYFRTKHIFTKYLMNITKSKYHNDHDIDSARAILFSSH